MKKTKVKIEVSSRHIHISQNELEKLFGKNYKLKVKRKLSQPGQFAAKETVTLKNGKREIDDVRIIGPVRNKTQIEISKTDSFALKLAPPVRASGNLKKSAGVTLIGPKGRIKLQEGVIIAARHIHISKIEADKLGLKNNQNVSVKVVGKRGLIFQNVKIRINDNFVFRMHIDTDEANSAEIENNKSGELLYE